VRRREFISLLCGAVLAPLRELRSTLSQMRLSDLAVGEDGRNRTLLSAFRARTGRNQPSNTRFRCYKVSPVTADGSHLFAASSSPVLLMLIGCVRPVVLALRRCWLGWHSGTSGACVRLTPLLFPTLCYGIGVYSRMRNAGRFVRFKK